VVGGAQGRARREAKEKGKSVDADGKSKMHVTRERKDKKICF